MLTLIGRWGKVEGEVDIATIKGRYVHILMEFPGFCGECYTSWGRKKFYSAPHIANEGVERVMGGRGCC